MAANLFVKATYTADADVLFKCASDFSDLLHATRKISKYRGLPPFQWWKARNMRPISGCSG